MLAEMIVLPNATPLRLAALGLWHEANTFVQQQMDLDTMEANGVVRGAEIRDRFAGGSSSFSGFLEIESLVPGVEVVPLVMAQLIPRGIITADALAVRVEEMLELLQQAGPFDGVLAAVHGAAVAEGCPDVDGMVLRRIREVVGPGVPIGAALDLHANVSAEMCANADVINAYRTNPHVDADATAVEIARLVVSAARGEIAPVIEHIALPLAVNILRQSTTELPMSALMAAADAVRAEPGVLTASVIQGFPYADVSEMGMSVVVVSDGDRNLARRAAEHLADVVWAVRADLDARAPNAAEAVGQVIAGLPDAAGPVLLLDVGDNIGGGSSGDSVALLNAARAAGLGSLLTIVADEAAAGAAIAAGVGASLHLRFGAAVQPEVGPPVEATATVLRLHDGVIVSDPGSAHAGVDRLDAGPTAAVRLDSGQTVVLTSRAAPPFSIAQVLSLGIDPREFAAIVAKGVHSPKAAYGPYVEEMIMVDTPGPTRAGLHGLDYVHRRRPMFPFEPITEWRQAPRRADRPAVP